MSNLSWRLLTGRITDAEYRVAIDAEYRGLRLEVARPGWSRRWGRVVYTVVSAVTFVLALAALSGSLMLIAAAMDLLP